MAVSLGGVQQLPSCLWLAAAIAYINTLIGLCETVS